VAIRISGGGRCVVCTIIKEKISLSFSFGGQGFYRYF
jgi:hypothetical protein